VTALDRDKARAVLRAVHADRDGVVWALDTLAEQCVVPAAPTIDRDAFLAAWDSLQDEEGLVDRDDLLAAILALVRPAEGAHLSPEDAATAAAGLNWASLHPTDGAPTAWGSEWKRIRDVLTAAANAHHVQTHIPSK